MVALDHCGEGRCLPHEPWTLKVGGPSLGDDGVVFTAAHPCGATIDDAGVQTPMIVIARYGGCVGGDGDGDLALVRASVVALSSTRGPGVPDHVDPCEPNALSALVELKIVVRSCGLPEPVIIDSDSEVVIPAGAFTVDVLAPVGWVAVNRGPAAVETPWVDATLRVTVCPCSCSYHPPGRLTETWPQNETLPATSLVRPRRARRVMAVAASQAGAAVSPTFTYRQRPGGTIMGIRTYSTVLPFPEDIYGAMPVIDATIAAGAGIGHITATWEIL